MESLVARMLDDLEAGKVTRRQFVQGLATVAAAAAAAPVSTSGAQGGFKTVSLDHISYQVADYKRTRDFYASLMGMTVANDNGSTQCALHFGDAMLIARNPHQGSRVSAPRVDHIAYRIDNWDTNRVKAELERRGLTPRLDTGGPIGPPNFASFHVQDPDGFDLQISGVARPGDSLYKK